MYIYGKLNTSEQIISAMALTDLGTEWIVMNSERPTTDGYIADASGNWVEDLLGEKNKAISKLKEEAKKYQEDRVGSTFYSLVLTESQMVSNNLIASAPKCQAVLQWCDNIIAEMDMRIGDVNVQTNLPITTSYDFSSLGNPPYTYEECRIEANL